MVLPIGDAAIATCLAIASGATILAWTAASQAEKLGEAVGNLDRACPQEWLADSVEIYKRPAPKPQPVPIAPVDPILPKVDVKETPQPSVRVRHYSVSILGIMESMVIRSSYGLYIWVEYPIITSYQKDAIRETVETFGRSYEFTTGFVEFNVDLNRWQLLPDPNLPTVPNAKIIHLFTATGLQPGFSLSEPGVNPEFYDKEGRLLR